MLLHYETRISISVKIVCNVCQIELEAENNCAVCGYDACSIHSSLEEDTLICDYCSGKNTSYLDRDLDDFAGTGE